MSPRVHVHERSRVLRDTRGSFRSSSYTTPGGAETDRAIEGVVTTPLGYVYGYSTWRAGAPDVEAQTDLSFVYNGREYLRTYSRAFRTHRGLAIVAGRFARAIVRQQLTGHSSGSRRAR